MGVDVNCNVGIISKRFKDILGPHGLDNRNFKGRQLLYLYKSNNFKYFYPFLRILIILPTEALMNQKTLIC